nr:FABP1 [Pseudechiniscus sp.]
MIHNTGFMHYYCYPSSPLVSSRPAAEFTAPEHFHSVSFSSFRQLFSLLLSPVRFATVYAETRQGNKKKMADLFVGKYKLESSENFEEYMKSIGVGMVMRKLGASATPVLTIWKEGDVYHVKSETTFKTTEIAFRLGEEFDEETPDGRKVKSVISQEGNKLIQVQRKDDFESIITREFDAQGLTATLVHKDVKSLRRYKRVVE